MSSSRATVGTDFPLSRTSRIAPAALNSAVNARRLRLAMTHSYRTFMRSGCPPNLGTVIFHAGWLPTSKARGLSESAVSNERERKSVGEEETFEIDTLDATFVITPGTW
jgi:hypothetical protein